ncbi:ABC transporter substrate-binding protein [Methanocaldococcus sp. 28A]
MFKKIVLLIMAILLTPLAFGENVGDINGDGSINIADVVYLFKHLNDIPLDVGDLNCDNSVDIADVVYLFNNIQHWSQPVVFAKNFEIEYYDANGIPVSYNDNWSYAILTTKYGDTIYNKYCIVKEGEKPPSNLPSDIKVIYAPVKKVATLSDFQVAMLEALDDDKVRESIKGVSKYTYIRIKDYGVFSDLKPYVDSGDIVPIGSPWGTIDKEALLNISPDIVFIPWSHGYLVQDINTVKDLGLNYLVTVESNEPTFLGKAEWIKVYATLYNLCSKGNDFFQKVWKKRNELLRKTYDVDYRPKVGILYWSPYSGPWVYCGQNCYAKLVSDFRGDYAFKDIPGTSYANLDEETTLEHLQGCDVLIYMNWNSLNEPINTLEDLKKDVPQLDPIIDHAKRVYVSKYNYGYDGYVHMDLLMEDFARMIHPECFDGGDSELHYFKKLK